MRFILYFQISYPAFYYYIIYHINISEVLQCLKEKFIINYYHGKKTNREKALLIEDARRIGKSTIAEEFGKNEYKSYIVVDFNDVSKVIKDAFD